MAIKQTIWSLDDKKALTLSSLNYENELEDLLDENISLLSDDWLIVGRQVRTLYDGIIDLLCIDVGGNLIVVELKKNKTPREVTAQTLDYASWVKTIDEDELAEIYLRRSKGNKSLGDAFQERFGVELFTDNDDADTRIVIVATGMDNSTERIIKYLQGYGIDINVLVFNVFEHQGRRLLSRAWMFEQEQVPKPPLIGSRNWNGEYYFSFGAGKERSWEDAVKFGFVSAGGGVWYTGTMRNLEVGNRIWVNIPHEGFVGVGAVTDIAKPASEMTFLRDGQEKNFFDLPLKANYHKGLPSEREEYIVSVDWLKTEPRSSAVSEYGFFGNQNTVCRPKTEKWNFTIKRLKDIWNFHE